MPKMKQRNFLGKGMMEGVILEFSEPRIIAEVAEYLKNNGYEVIAQKYIFGITDYDQSLPYKKSEIQIQLEEWIDWNTELVWEFYVNILEKHKNEWNK